MLSSLKLLEQFSPDFKRGLLSKGYCQFVQMVTRSWTKWPPCPYMVETLKNLLLQNQECFGAESWYIALRTRSTKFVQMMIIGWPLTFLRQGQICVSMHFYGENVDKSFSQNVLKNNGWNLQCVIKVTNILVIIKILTLEGNLPFPLGYIHV